MSHLTSDQISVLEGNSYLFNGNKIKVHRTEYVEKTGVVIVHLKEGEMKVFKTLEAFNIDFWDNCEPLNIKGKLIKHVPNKLPKLQTFEQVNATQLSKRLFGLIDKVEADPGFIEQAKSICDISKTIISMAKTEIDYIRATRVG